MGVPIGTGPRAAINATRTSRGTANRRELWREVKRHRTHYAFLVPMVVLFAGFTAWPTVASWVYAFFEWDGYEPLTDFVGLANFQEAVNDASFWQTVRNTFSFTAAAVLIEIPLALGLALVLNNRFLAGRNLYRILIFLPVVSNTAVIGIVFAVLLDPTGGTVNSFLTDANLVDRAINFLGSSDTALLTIIAIATWKGLGTTMIYWLAGLQTIPPELYDAAKVDGAGRWQEFRNVTLPLLVPIGVVILLLTIITSFGAFDLVQTMTAGGPNGATEIIPTYIYRYAFNPEGTVPRYGFASAVGVFFGLMTLAITIAQVILTRRFRS